MNAPSEMPSIPGQTAASDASHAGQPPPTDTSNPVQDLQESGPVDSGDLSDEPATPPASPAEPVPAGTISDEQRARDAAENGKAVNAASDTKLEPSSVDISRVSTEEAYNIVIEANGGFGTLVYQEGGQKELYESLLAKKYTPDQAKELLIYAMRQARMEPYYTWPDEAIGETFASKRIVNTDSNRRIHQIINDVERQEIADLPSPVKRERADWFLASEIDGLNQQIFRLPDGPARKDLQNKVVTFQQELRNAIIVDHHKRIKDQFVKYPFF